MFIYLITIFWEIVLEVTTVMLLPNVPFQLKGKTFLKDHKSFWSMKNLNFSSC